MDLETLHVQLWPVLRDLPEQPVYQSQLRVKTSILPPTVDSNVQHFRVPSSHSLGTAKIVPHVSILARGTMVFFCGVCMCGGGGGRLRALYLSVLLS